MVPVSIWTPAQLHELESQFQISQHCSMAMRKALSEKLNVQMHHITRWFEERRDAYFFNEAPNVSPSPKKARKTPLKTPRSSLEDSSLFSYSPVKAPPPKHQIEASPPKHLIEAPPSKFQIENLSFLEDGSMFSLPVKAPPPKHRAEAPPPKHQIEASPPKFQIEAPPPKHQIENLSFSEKLMDLTLSSLEVSPVPLKASPGLKLSSSEMDPFTAVDLEVQLRVKLDVEYRNKHQAALRYQESEFNAWKRAHLKNLEQANRRIEFLQWQLNKDPNAQLLSFLETLVNSFLIDERKEAQRVKSKNEEKRLKSKIRIWFGRHKFAVAQLEQLTERLNDESLPEKECVREGRALRSADIEYAFQKAAVELAIKRNLREEPEPEPASFFGPYSDPKLIQARLETTMDRINRKRKSE